MKEVAVINTLTQDEINTFDRSGEIRKGEFNLVIEDVIISSEDIPGSGLWQRMTISPWPLILPLLKA